MQSNTARFERFNKYVNQIFPQIHKVTVSPLEDNNNREVEILIWTVPPETERVDLAIPLSESGTGIGQVLAILYVIMETKPQIIIIDELQSFLHPGAAKKLVEILKQNPQHQYIISTHSPDVLSATNPATIIMLNHENYETKLKPINKNASSELKDLLYDVGAKLSDVFGADQILWVEGPTEERCFPMIIEKLLQKTLMGINVVGVINTGDLEGKHKRLVYQIYHKMSSSDSLLPTALAFIFDKEGKSTDLMADLKRESRGATHFLPRTMYENYLLNVEAITGFVNSIENFSEQPIIASSISDWMDKRHKEDKYWKGIEKNGFSDWKKNIHAAKLLEDLFKNFSTKVEYRKTEHSVKLTEYIIEHHPKDFDELAQLLNNIIK